MFRKISSLILVLCIFCTSVGYAEKADSEILSSETIITQDNIYEVLKYLNIDSENFIADSTVSSNIYTVGDLEKSIKEVQKLPKQETVTLTENISINEMKEMSTNGTIPDINFESSKPNAEPLARGPKGTKILEDLTQLGSYKLLFRVTGQFDNRRWTGVGSINAIPKSTGYGTTHKISSLKNLSATYTSSAITLKGSVVVDIYVGIGKAGLLKTGSQTVKPTIHWLASKYLGGGGGTR